VARLKQLPEVFLNFVKNGRFMAINPTLSYGYIFHEGYEKWVKNIKMPTGEVFLKPSIPRVLVTINAFCSAVSLSQRPLRQA
jgi:hypothetical protein